MRVPTQVGALGVRAWAGAPQQACPEQVAQETR
jgi:hypothetical protein